MIKLLTVFLLLEIVQFSICYVSSGKNLAELRELMKSNKFDAYIIPSEDEHQSEYVSKYDKRRQWISGFSGSSGVAVVTQNKAALWADSRYYIQADKELDPSNWNLMKASELETPKIEEWLKNETQIKQVGQSSKFCSIKGWQSREMSLNKANITLVDPMNELIDQIWITGRAPRPNDVLEIHNITYSGKSFSEKIDLVQQKIKDASATIFVVTALDEVAWLFNLRGSDIPYNPMFFAYAIINADNTEPHKLYINQTRDKFDAIKTYLKDDNVEIVNYEDIIKGIKKYNDNNSTIWITPESSYYIYNAVSKKDNIISLRSPIRAIKAVKNEQELKVNRICQIRDSAARIKHMHWLETEMKKGTIITEKSSAKKLEEFQGNDQDFKEPSFGSISAVGANAAIVHYSTEEGENAKLEKSKIYLLDAGGQYRGCTTDVTRTHHYGEPSYKEKLTYTKVMQGSINLASAIFPSGVLGRSVDVLARGPLWDVGLDYGHGTGHGIGHFLSVHENPPTTSWSSKSEEPYEIGMITSDEPGYYDDGLFGIRLETDLEVVKAVTKFDTLTFVPFEKNLIDICLLTNAQVDWLNEYNKLINEKVGPLLDKAEQEYLKTKTENFIYSNALPECNDSNRATLFALDFNLIILTFIVAIRSI